jgi:uncharacterized protein YndB with AHSA1/START domain
MVEGKGTEPASVTSMELRSGREIVIARSFDAPPRVVFDAWTRPEIVKRWWAPASHRVTVASCEADVRVGGKYRYALLRDTGQELALSGEYTEVVPPSRLVYTQVFEPMRGAGHVVVTVTFEPRGGKTLLLAHEMYPSNQARDAAIASGMEHGMRETMEQLDAVVGELRDHAAP